MGAEADFNKPEIYKYHDYREYLKDLIEYLNQKHPKEFTLRQIARKAGVTVSYLSLVLKGLRKFTIVTQDKVFPVLKLGRSERSYLRLLCQLADTENAEERKEALTKLQRFPSYSKLNQDETEVYKYLTAWHYVAIREMTDLPDFDSDPKWIQARLKRKVALPDIKEAIEFLEENNYIEFNKQAKKYQKTKRGLNCSSGVYRVALESFHTDMYSLATDSMRNTQREKRIMDAYTFPIGQEDIDSVKKIIGEALDKIEALSGKIERKKFEDVYHVSIAGFPLTGKTTDKTEGSTN